VLARGKDLRQLVKGISDSNAGVAKVGSIYDFMAHTSDLKDLRLLARRQTSANSNPAEVAWIEFEVDQVDIHVKCRNCFQNSTVSRVNATKIKPPIRRPEHV